MRPISLLALLLAGGLAGCPTSPADDDDTTPDADDDDSTAADDDDSTPPDDDDATVDDDDVTPPPATTDIAQFPSFVSSRQNDWAGEAVAIVGDVNGDGFDDFAIGAPAGGRRSRARSRGRSTSSSGRPIRIGALRRR
jgi:hypothetical protein